MLSIFNQDTQQDELVNVTVFMVPHEIFAEFNPKHDCLDHVYYGPDEAILDQKVIKIGKQIVVLLKSEVVSVVKYKNNYFSLTFKICD